MRIDLAAQRANLRGLRVQLGLIGLLLEVLHLGDHFADVLRKRGEFVAALQNLKGIDLSFGQLVHGCHQLGHAV